MSKIKTNCFRFTTSGENGRQMRIIAGMVAEKTHRHGKTGYFVRLRSKHFNHVIPVTSDVVVTKPDGRRYMYYADVTNTGYNDRQKVQLEIAPCHTHCDTTLILVNSYEDVIYNGGASNPHFSGVNTWIGADGIGLILQVGAHQSPYKKQLFRLHESESILFFDSTKEVTRVTARKCGEEPALQRATNGEVADYVLGEAKKRGEDNRGTLGWCFYALQELGCRKQLDDFCQMFPSFWTTRRYM